MRWSADPELQKMFLDELDERSARLAAGVVALREGTVTSDIAGGLMREGHTIKGTGRVMGYEVVSVAGHLLEQAFRAIQHDKLSATHEMADAFAELVDVLPAAGRADPDTGTPALAAAITKAATHVEMFTLPELPEPAPEAAPEITPIAESELSVVVVAESPGRRRGDGQTHPEEAPPESELGELVAAVRAWARDDSVMVNAGRLSQLMNSIAGANHEFGAVSEDDGGDPGAAEIRDTLDRLQFQALELRAAPVLAVISPLSQLVGYIAKKLKKEVRFRLSADNNMSVDLQVLEQILDPIRQLLVNAVRHGIEDSDERRRAEKPVPGTVKLEVSVEDRMLTVAVIDDGAGVDWDLVRRKALSEGRISDEAVDDPNALRDVLFAAGFSTGERTDLRVGTAGLAAVAAVIEDLHGRIAFESAIGRGTTVRLTLPAYSSVQRLLLVEAGGVRWGLPEAAVDDVLLMEDVEMRFEPDGPVIEWNGNALDVHHLGGLAGMADGPPPSHLLMLKHRLGSAAIGVDTVGPVREIVAREAAALAEAPSFVHQVAILGDGDPLLVAHPGRLVEIARSGSHPERPEARILVVDDSMGARAVVSSSLASSGFTTSVAASVDEAMAVLGQIEVDALVVDYSMPHADGVALVEAVRARHRDLPILMLSGVADEADRKRASKAGVDGFFDKADFNEGSLADTLWEMVEAQSAPRSDAS